MARGSFYAGGGSSLFRTQLLKEFVRDSRGYSPFYWEDADWGARAWAEGLECLFVPASRAVHEHRGTIKRRFNENEIARIVSRNELLFELRNYLSSLGGIRAIAHLASQVAATRRDLRSVAVALGVAKVRARANAAKRSGFSFAEVIQKYYAPRWRSSRPTVLWVTPFAVCPPSHGGARRIVELARRLGRDVNLLLLSDEGLSYAHTDEQQFAPFLAVHVLQARKDMSGPGAQDLRMRMYAHAPPALRSELRRLQQQYSVDLVQVEFMETARLVEERVNDIPFVASLHDVYVDGGKHDALQLDILRRYDSVVTCSQEDAAWLPGLANEVVGNGAVDRYAQSSPSPHNKKVLFMGPFRYQQNFTGILAFLEQVWPSVLAAYPDAELMILGGPESADARFRHQALQQKGVQLVSEFVDPAPVLAACALTINPQQDIRGSALKVAEALLARRICVSTQQGARGFDQLDTGALRICTNWDAMRDELVMLLGDTPLRHELEQSSAQVRSALSWDGKADQLLALYRRLLPGHFRQEIEA
jgi:glycosyltransferase involved in cell wall biosynthesis